MIVDWALGVLGSASPGLIVGELARPSAKPLQLTVSFHIFTLMKSAETFLELKNDTAQIILALRDEAILAKVREILEEAEVADGRWYDSLDDEDKASVDRADADIAAGRLHSHDDVKAELKQWLKE